MIFNTLHAGFSLTVLCDVLKIMCKKGNLIVMRIKCQMAAVENQRIVGVKWCAPYNIIKKTYSILISMNNTTFGKKIIARFNRSMIKCQTNWTFIFFLHLKTRSSSWDPNNHKKWLISSPTVADAVSIQSCAWHSSEREEAAQNWQLKPIRSGPVRSTNAYWGLRLEIEPNQEGEKAVK